MRILQVITSLKIGGAEHIVVQLVRLLRKKGHEVDVVVFDGEETSFTRELRITGCKIYSLGYGYYDLRNIAKLRKIMCDYNIIHTHNSSPQFFAAIANIGLGKVMVTTEHNTDNRKRHCWAMVTVDRWMYKKYDRIITISNQAETNLRQYLSRSSNHPALGRIVTILNGVDISSIYRAKAYQDGELRDEHGEEMSISELVNIIQVAAFRPQKDQKTLIDALQYLDEKYVVWIVGDGELREELHIYAASSAQRNRIFFFGNRNDVPRLLKTADIVCMSTHYEGLSLSNIEGMSTGKPFVASDVDGIHEVTKGAGILFPQGDAEALAKAIRQLHEDSAYYHEVAERCYERALQFDISKMVEGYNNIYKQVFTHETSDN